MVARLHVCLANHESAHVCGASHGQLWHAGEGEGVGEVVGEGEGEGELEGELMFMVLGMVKYNGMQVHAYFCSIMRRSLTFFLTPIVT